MQNHNITSRLPNVMSVLNTIFSMGNEKYDGVKLRSPDAQKQATEQTANTNSLIHMLNSK